MHALRIDVWSDIACPWCWVGKRHLEAALAQYDNQYEGQDVHVQWHAFELNPSASKHAPDTIDYVERLASKYQTSRDEAQAMIDRMCQVGASVDLEFRFDRVRPTNTFDAHRLLASCAGRSVQTELKERLFAAYMNEGRAISDHGVLAELAADVGLDADQVQAILSTDAHAAAVRADERHAASIGVTGVPFFVIDERYAVSGAQPSNVLLGAIERARNDARSDAPEADAPACGPDGCELPNRS